MPLYICACTDVIIRIVISPIYSALCASRCSEPLYILTITLSNRDLIPILQMRNGTAQRESNLPDDIVKQGSTFRRGFDLGWPLWESLESRQGSGTCTQGKEFKDGDRHSGCGNQWLSPMFLGQGPEGGYSLGSTAGEGNIVGPGMDTRGMWAAESTTGAQSSWCTPLPGPAQGLALGRDKSFFPTEPESATDPSPAPGQVAQTTNNHW